MAANGCAVWPCINEGAVKSTLIAKEIKQVIAFECLIGWSGGVGKVRRRIKVTWTSDFPIHPH